MKLFIDTANVEDIKAANELGVICGVTTNPSLVVKEGKGAKEFRQLVKDITEIVDGPVSAEVIALDHEGMVKEARELAQISKNVVIKIPMCEEGLKAVHVLSSEGIHTNVTLIFSAGQALLAARAGATYVSPFVGRIDDTGHNGLDLIADIAEIFAIHGIETEIISASIRNPIHAIESAKLGAHIATVPYNVIKQMIGHPQTSAGIEKFVSDWESMR